MIAVLNTEYKTGESQLTGVFSEEELHDKITKLKELERVAAFSVYSLISTEKRSEIWVKDQKENEI